MNKDTECGEDGRKMNWSFQPIRQESEGAFAQTINTNWVRNLLLKDTY